MTELFEAHRQWRSRPEDERFESLAQLHAVTQARKEASQTSTVRSSNLHFEVSNDVRADGTQEVVLAGDQNVLVPSHWALSNLANYSDAPRGLLPLIAMQPADLAAKNLNWMIQRATEQRDLSMLWANGSENVVRCFSTPKYKRLWDADVVAAIRAATNDEQGGWHRPAARTDGSYPSGYYAGDRDMFAFMVNDTNRLDDGSPEGLGRGFFVANSEVVKASWWMCFFYYRRVCGNHIVWGAQTLLDTRIMHSGDEMGERAIRRMQELIAGFEAADLTTDQLTINLARAHQIGTKMEDSLKLLTSKPIGFSVSEGNSILEQTIKTVGNDNPTNLYDVFNGATSLSQLLFKNADQRMDWDRKAARLLEVPVR